jgi:hypothetical protein
MIFSPITFITRHIGASPKEWAGKILVIVIYLKSAAEYHRPKKGLSESDRLYIWEF